MGYIITRATQQKLPLKQKFAILTSPQPPQQKHLKATNVIRKKVL